MKTIAYFSSLEDCSEKDRATIFRLAEDMPEIEARKPMEGLILGNVFFKSNEWVRLGLASAFIRLGGRVQSIHAGPSSGLALGESLEDCIQSIGACCDVLAVCHDDSNAVRLAGLKSRVPIVQVDEKIDDLKTYMAIFLFITQFDYAEVTR